MGGARDEKDEASKSLELNLHRSILVENSSFFSAQLSDRWRIQAPGTQMDGRFS